MKRNRLSPGRLFCLGLLFALLFFFLSALLFCGVAYMTDDPTAHMRILALGAYLFSGALSALVICNIGKRNDANGTRCALLVGLSFPLICLSAGVILSSGKLPLSSLMNHLCYLLVSAFFTYLSSHKKKRKIR